MNKKGVELSMNVIIIAAIGLLVLVILAVLVINGAGKVPTTTQNSCNVQGGACQATSCQSTAAIITPNDCPTARPNCCKIIVTTATG
jgi:flagellar basal body-associated protein FliL